MYSTDQVYFFYKENRKSYLDDCRMSANILANSLIYATPVSDKKDISRKQRSWNKFIDSLDWRKVTKKDKMTVDGVMSSFGRTFGAIMIKDKTKKGDS